MSRNDTTTQQTKQNEKTKQYWDAFYSDLSSQAPLLKHSEKSSWPTGKKDDSDGLSENDVGGLEWIVDNSAILLDQLLNMFPTSSMTSPANELHAGTLNVLEIGCGVSELSRFLLERLLINSSQSNEFGMSYEFVVTDVSSVCVEQNRKRDEAFMTSLEAYNTNNSFNTGSSKNLLPNHNDSLSYKTLDVLTQNPTIQNHYDIILDKGTLDTFLFRSKRTNRGTEAYPPILMPLLNNIHSWLRHGVTAKYIFISPRSKIKAVRDYNGFVKVRRVALDVATLGGNVFLHRNNKDSNSNSGVYSRKNVFIYECIRNDDYRPERDGPFRSQNHSNGARAGDDRSMCPHCKQSFRDFRGKVEIRDQGIIVWGRRWKNHLIHCKGS